VSNQAASAVVPAPLLASTVKAGALLAVGQAVTAVVSANVAALTQGVLKAMFLTKLKTVLALVVMAGVLALTAGALGSMDPADPGPAVAQADPPPSAQKQPKPAKDQPKQKIETKKIAAPDGR